MSETSWPIRAVAAADRLKSLPGSRVEGPAAAALTVSQVLVDACAGIEARDQPGPPNRRLLPDLGPFVVGDQLLVAVNDLVAAIQGLTDVEVWAPDGTRADLTAVLAQVRDAVEQIG